MRNKMWFILKGSRGELTGVVECVLDGCAYANRRDALNALDEVERKTRESAMPETNIHHPEEGAVYVYHNGNRVKWFLLKEIEVR